MHVSRSQISDFAPAPKIESRIACSRVSLICLHISLHRHLPVVLSSLASGKGVLGMPFSSSRYEHCRQTQSSMIPYNHLAWARLRLCMLALRQMDGRALLHHAAALCRLIQGASLSSEHMRARSAHMRCRFCSALYRSTWFAYITSWHFFRDMLYANRRPHVTRFKYIDMVSFRATCTTTISQAVIHQQQQRSTVQTLTQTVQLRAV